MSRFSELSGFCFAALSWLRYTSGSRLAAGAVLEVARRAITRTREGRIFRAPRWRISRP